MNTMNKRTKHISILFASFVVALLASCGDADITDYILSSDYVSADKTVTTNGDATTTSFNIDANCSWTITGQPSWMTVTPSNGSGATKVTVNFTSENPSALNSRTANLTLTTADGITKTIAITQQPATEKLTVSPTSFTSLNADAHTEKVVIQCNSKWTVSGASDWITLSTSSGEGNGEFSFNIAANDSEDDRTATLTVRGQNQSTIQTITVKQAGAVRNISVSPLTLSAPAVSSVKEITLSGDADWQLSSNAAWATPDKLSGTGSGSVKITVDANTSNSPRSATITIVTKQTTHTVTITQAEGTAPSIGTTTSSNITKHSADITSSYTSDFSVTEYGVCYSATSKTPTISDSKKSFTGSSVSGSISANLSNLDSGVKYYVRAYAVNEIGISYGSVIEVVTNGGIPSEGDNVTPNM